MKWYDHAKSEALELVSNVRMRKIKTAKECSLECFQIRIILFPREHIHINVGFPDIRLASLSRSPYDIIS